MIKIRNMFHGFFIITENKLLYYATAIYLTHRAGKDIKNRSRQNKMIFQNYKLYEQFFPNVNVI